MKENLKFEEPVYDNKMTKQRHQKPPFLETQRQLRPMLQTVKVEEQYLAYQLLMELSLYQIL